MFCLSRLFVCAVITLVSYGAPVSADTLRCQTSNGNTNCVGSNGVSCQTTNGQKTCVSGHGDVVQSIGSAQAMPSNGNDDVPQDVPAVRRWLERHGLISHMPADAGLSNND